MRLSEWPKARADLTTFARAIADYNRAIELRPDFAEAYTGRGVVYVKKGEYDRAIADYNKAIALKPDLAYTYFNRGITRLHLRVWENAKSDLTTAQNMGVDIIAAFHNESESVSDFESKHDIHLPADIATMLTEQS